MKKLAVYATLAVLAHAVIVVWHLFVLANIPPGLTGQQLLSAACGIVLALVAMKEQPIEIMCVPTQVCQDRLRAVRPRDDAPKEMTPRTKSARSSVQCAAAKKPAEVTSTARPQW
jgi:hypothetical protein